MYESERGFGGLDPETLRRMREVFGDHVCCVCRARAARCRVDQYYCHEHYPQSRETRRSPRVYKCQLPVEG